MAAACRAGADTSKLAKESAAAAKEEDEEEENEAKKDGPKLKLDLFDWQGRMIVSSVIQY
jgi:hypothetical protein